MDEDEAKSIASAWVRKLEANILSKVQHDNNIRKHRHQHENTVTNVFRDDKPPQSYSPPKSMEKIYSESTTTSRTRNLSDPKSDDKSHSNLTSLERNSRRETQIQVQSSRNSTRTPRVDLEIVRQKRLQHFEKNQNHVVRNSQEGEKLSDQQESFATGNIIDFGSTMLQCEANPRKRLDENSPHFEGDPWAYGSYDCGLHSQRSDDDDKLRLELWGLRGAVESGQLDIHSYLRPAARSSASRQNFQNNSLANQYRQTTTNSVNTHCSLSQDELSKLSSFRDNNFNITSIDSNGDLRIDSSGEENLNVLTSMLTIEVPQGGGEGHDFCSSQHKPLNESPLGRGEGQNCADSTNVPVYFNSSKCPSASSFQDVMSCEPKEDFTRFTVSKDESSTQLGGPLPQIAGKLYNGFETSDSESSVYAVNTQWRDKIKSANAAKPKSSKSPRGKQKILSELTEYLAAERSNKKLHKEVEKRGNEYSDLEQISREHTSEEKRGDFQNSNTSKTPVSEDIDFDNSFVEKLYKSSSPVAVHQNGFRSHSISPENHEYISKSAPITYNRDIDICTDNSFGGYATYTEEEPRFGSIEKQCYDHHFQVLGKSCPSCQEVNSKAANWCIECGTALVAVKPTVLNQKQSQEYEEDRKKTNKLIDETLDYERNSLSLTSLSKVERDLNQDIITLSKEVDKNSGFSNESLQSNLSSYKRRWQKSSIAWRSYEPQELSKPPSINKPSKNDNKKELQKSKERCMDASLRSRSSSNLTVVENGKKKSKLKNGSNSRQRSTSETYHDDYDTGSLSINFELTNKKSPRGSKSTKYGRPKSGKPNKEMKSSRNRPSSARPQSKSPSPLCKEVVSPTKKAVTNSVDIPQLNLDDIGSYDRILTLIRSQRDSEPVPYLYLPDEIILEIFSNLSNQDLVSCASVCSQFYRIAMDESLWKTIVIRKNRSICDEWFESIGDRHPSSLTISQCSGNKISSEGLRRLFRKCSESLEEVDFSGCSGGELIGESILLHISVRCFNVVSVDVSWTNVSDNGVQELSKNLKRLECLCLNGCQAITDNSLTAVAKRHGDSLRIFEVFGCFNLTPAGLLLFGSQCSHLQTLNIGQCHKMTDSAVGNLVSHLPEIENLDLRGCKQTRDSAVKKIVRHCPHLKSLVLANCPLITDSTLAEISANLADIESLDVCGCSYITDAGVRALARSCHKLELLDLSSTGNTVTSKSIVALSNYCSQSLRVLKLSFCSDISVHTVNQVVKNCKKLTLLHLYGCKRIKEVDKIKNINPNLVIEK